MATYFHGGPEIQANTNPGDHLQTLYLMNPNYFSYFDNTSHNTTTSNNTSHNNNNNNNNENENPHNMFFINHSGGPNALLRHAPPPHQQLIGIPLAGTHTDSHHGRPSSSATSEIPSSLHGLGVPSRVHHNLWGPTMDPSPAQHGPIQTGTQGLSLSLSPQKVAVTTLGSGDGRMSVTVAAAAGGSCVSNGVQGVVLGSKYLKAAQELLDEVVNVGDFNKGESSGVHKSKPKVVDPTSDGFEGGNTAGKKVVEQLTAAQRQELQMKKVKLLTMLDEVEQRYRQYHTQMQMVISFFEQAAGISSAKSYTSTALQTISRQFRCLKDTITSQIKSTSESLGKDDKNDGGSGEGGVGSRLKFVDHQLRQQRALQQLGMMQHNAWRPQRGLPERAVSVLRAWLFEHFLHPYPKDSDKHMLSKQTGLTRSQVSNWFINARVRLWKPMVEEMYAEEVKTQEHSNNVTTTNPETTNTSINDQNKSNSRSKQPTITHHQQDPSASIIHHTDHQSTNDTSSQGFSLIGSSSDMESLMGRSPKKQRSGSEIQQHSPSSILSMDMEMKPLNHNHQHQTNKYTQDHQRQAHIINNGSEFNPYLVQEMGRFDPDPLATHHYSGNGVSLTLGLPHCDNLSLGNHQQDFINQGMNLGRRLDVGANEGEFCGISMSQQPSHPSNNGYDSIDIQNRTRFAAQLLHDFVA